MRWGERNSRLASKKKEGKEGAALAPPLSKTLLSNNKKTQAVFRKQIFNKRKVGEKLKHINKQKRREREGGAARRWGEAL